MFAIKLFGANDVRLVECEIPKIEEEEILVKTCVLCNLRIRSSYDKEWLSGRR